MFSPGLVQTRKQPVRAKTCFSFKIKNGIVLLQLAAILKNKLKLFKLDSKILLVCHNAVTSTKSRNMKAIPTLILLEGISIKIMGRGLLQSYLWHKASETGFSTNYNTARHKSFPESHFSSFVIKQRGNSWKLRWVNSTILSNKIWLTLRSYVVFMSNLLAFVYEKVIYITFWSVRNWR